jgi:single-stranded-DNA-specific exonuclease
MAVDTPPPPAAPAEERESRRLLLEPCPTAAVARLEAELGVSNAVAQVLVRRGFGDPDEARSWLAAGDAHAAAEFRDIDVAVALIRRHVAAGSRITVHGDYDVDGVCSTAILVRALRSLGAEADWYLPSRTEDGYGLNAKTVERLAAAGTQLLITADCAITAVDEVAAARAAGMDVVVTDHHTPRADGALPDAPIVHPGLCDYPCAHLCAAGVALKLAEALEAPTAAEDLDLAALATVADVVSLTGENRRIVREGLRALATTGKPGLRALMRVARVDPTRLDATAVGFRLAPRINAAGRLYRADAGLELVLTADAQRAQEVADELDRANAERRHVEERIRWEAEAQVAEQGPQSAYVLAGEGWHPGVIGIVASRIAERHHRPAVLIALDPETGRGTGSGRSIPAFDLLGGLDACAAHLARHGGHRAAAGLEIAGEDVDAFRAAFTEHAAGVLGPDELVREERADAIVAGGDLGLELAEELERLAPFGHGNPGVRLLVPAARLTDPRPMGEGRHVRFTVAAGGVRARGVAFGCDGRLPVAEDAPADAIFTLELDEYRGVVEPRLLLRHAQPCVPEAIVLVGEPEDDVEAALAELRAGAPAAAPPAVSAAARPSLHDRRDRGVAGTIAALAASGEPVLVVAADARARRRQLGGRLGGFALCSWRALERAPSLAGAHAHVVAVDPPATAPQRALLQSLAGERAVHLAWGEPERAFAAAVAEREGELRPAAAALYRALRDGAPLADALRAAGPPGIAGRALRALAELGLVDPEQGALLPAAGRTELDRAPIVRAESARAAESGSLLRIQQVQAA